MDNKIILRCDLQNLLIGIILVWVPPARVIDLWLRLVLTIYIVGVNFLLEIIPMEEIKEEEENDH